MTTVRDWVRQFEFETVWNSGEATVSVFDDNGFVTSAAAETEFEAYLKLTSTVMGAIKGAGQ